MRLELFLADVSSGEMRTMLKESNKYFIDITDDLTFVDDDEFIWSSEKNGYNHLYLYKTDGSKLRQLTSGNYDVTKFYGYDKERNRIYYQAAERSPMMREIYSVDLKAKNKICHAKSSGYNSAQFSSTFDYYVLNQSQINKPPVYTVFNNKNQVVREIENNEGLRSMQKSHEVSPVEFFSFTTKDEVELNAYMIKPNDFDENKKYPVFMYLYGGPGSQQVTDSWKGQNYWWFQMLADAGYIVVCVDNRGTGARGEEFRKMTYLNLGKYETIDQIEAG